MSALGMIESTSFIAVIEAADAMVKSANVELVNYAKTGGGCVTAIVRGDVASVKSAVEAGRLAAIECTNERVSSSIIASPHGSLESVFPIREALK